MWENVPDSRIVCLVYLLCRACDKWLTSTPCLAVLKIWTCYISACIDPFPVFLFGGWRYSWIDGPQRGLKRFGSFLGLLLTQHGKQSRLTVLAAFCWHYWLKSWLGRSKRSTMDVPFQTTEVNSLPMDVLDQTTWIDVWGLTVALDVREWISLVMHWISEVQRWIS